MPSAGLPSAGRMALAVVVGYGVMAAIVTTGTFLVVFLLGLPPQGPPTTRYLAGNIAISFLAAVCGGYACARLAPDNRRAITVGLLIFLLLSAASATWRMAPEAARQPPGYLPLVALLGVVGVWAGAMVERARHGKSKQASSSGAGDRRPT